MRLRRPRRARLRTRVLIGVLAVTLVALVAFDVAAVTALRGYLLSRLPPDLGTLARTRQAVTVPSRDGSGQVRLMAMSFPGLGTVYATTSLSSLDKTTGQLELILIIGSAAAGAIAAGGVAWVIRGGLRPVEVMAGQADKINAGDLTDRVSPHDPRTEMGRLGAALNGMLARIGDFVAERESSQEATRRFFADVNSETVTDTRWLPVSPNDGEQAAGGPGFCGPLGIG
jgi:two-component system, OmpR family, sensor kinase